MAPPRLQPPPRGPLPSVELHESREPLFRIQDTAQLIYRTYPEPRYRFDAPGGRYPILYTNDSKVGVFAEVYVDRARRLGTEDAGRRLVEITPRSALALIDLTSDETLGAFELDERISTGDDYERCQQWALHLYRAMPNLQGIRYGARCAGRRCANVALFADRCAALLDVRDLGRLADLEEVVLRAADRYNLSVAFLV